MTNNEPVEDIARPDPSDADPEPTSGPPARADTQVGLGAPAPTAPALPRKKRKRRKSSEEASPVREGIPGFAAGFPRDPELDRLVEAFERGDYGLVRADAARLANGDERDEVREAARELLRRNHPDPPAVILLGAAVALLVVLAAWYWAHGGAAS